MFCDHCLVHLLHIQLIVLCWVNYHDITRQTVYYSLRQSQVTASNTGLNQYPNWFSTDVVSVVFWTQLIAHTYFYRMPASPPGPQHRPNLHWTGIATGYETPYKSCLAAACPILPTPQNRYQYRRWSLLKHIRHICLLASGLIDDNTWNWREGLVMC